MKGQLKAVWNVLRGKPTLYGVQFVGTVTVVDQPLWVDACAFRGDSNGKGGLRIHKP